MAQTANMGIAARGVGTYNTPPVAIPIRFMILHSKTCIDDLIL